MTGTGTFKVNLKPLNGYAAGENGVKLGRMSLDKQFFGTLEATSRGEMLSATTPVEGSAGYVAVEQVTGTLAGQEGSFVLQHFGTLARGHDRLLLEVVPDSGTGQLTGLSGQMAITIENGEHRYEFDYMLSPAS